MGIHDSAVIFLVDMSRFKYICFLIRHAVKRVNYRELSSTNVPFKI